MADTLVILYPQEPYNVLYGRNYLYQRHSIAEQSGIQPETNVHFIGRYQPPQYRYLQSQRENPALDLPPAAQPPEAPSQPFVIIYDYQTYNVVKPGRLFYFQQDVPFQPPPALQPETNPHFIGKFDQGGYVFFSSSEDTTQSGVTAQPETNTHFVGRYTVHKHRLPNYFVPDYPFQPPPPVPETNIHFIGKYRPTIYSRPINSRDTGTAGPLAVQPETNRHFIGSYRPTRHLRWVGAYHAPALDRRPEIGTVFLDLQEGTGSPVESIGGMSATLDSTSTMAKTEDAQGLMSTTAIDLTGAFV